MVYAHVLGTCGETRGGSSPLLGTEGDVVYLKHTNCLI